MLSRFVSIISYRNCCLLGLKRPGQGLLTCVCGAQAKTHEGVDSLGENRSIACHAVVMLMRDPQQPNMQFIHSEV